MTDYKNLFGRVKGASRLLAVITDDIRSAAINTLADMLENESDDLLEANRLDLELMDENNPLYDRLRLTHGRIADIAAGLRAVAALECPVGEVMEHRTLPNGIDLSRVRVPFGVIGVIYEARPNVTFDVAALCIKTGNACILKGGHDADNSNRFAASLITRALQTNGIPAEAVTLLPSDHDSTRALLEATGFVDVCIPRGGHRLIDFVRDNARVPVIETGAGVVHLYFDSEGATDIGAAVICNAKTRRVSVCNALDTLLIHRDRLQGLPELVAPLADRNVDLYCDDKALAALTGSYPSALLHKAESWDTEWMDFKMGVRTVSSIDEAIAHIAVHGSGHSESIVTESDEAFNLFAAMVDASCVYRNLPTSFTDGGQFGLGAEIGISTQKLGPRGPMGLREITTYKYVLTGSGQLRP